MLSYRLMLRARKHPRVEHAVHRWERLRGAPPIRSEAEWLTGFVAPGRSFADVGGMWGIDGEIAIRAAELGADPVTLVDFYTTDQFLEKRAARAAGVRVVLGSADDAAVVEEVGAIDRVWCWGVLYHHPAPGAILAALRMITRERLCLEVRTIPEVPGMPQASVFWPYLPPTVARRYSHSRYGLTTQMAIDVPYDPEARGANDFWGLTPSAVIALAGTCGLRCVSVARSPKGPQRHVFEFEPVPAPYVFPFGEPPN